MMSSASLSLDTVLVEAGLELQHDGRRTRWASMNEVRILIYIAGSKIWTPYCDRPVTIHLSDWGQSEAKSPADVERSASLGWDLNFTYLFGTFPSLTTLIPSSYTTQTSTSLHWPITGIGNPHSLAIQSLHIHTPRSPSHHTIPTLHIWNSSTLFRSRTVSLQLYANPDYVSCAPDPLSYSPLLICARPNSSVSTNTIILLSFSMILLTARECDQYPDTSHRYRNHIVLLKLSLFVPI